jgi:hypothetical protein
VTTCGAEVLTLNKGLIKGNKVMYSTLFVFKHGKKKNKILPMVELHYLLDLNIGMEETYFGFSILRNFPIFYLYLFYCSVLCTYLYCFVVILFFCGI